MKQAFGTIDPVLECLIEDRLSHSAVHLGMHVEDASDAGRGPAIIGFDHNMMKANQSLGSEIYP